MNNERGFTVFEVVVALFVVGLLVASIWSIFAAVDETERESFREADRRGAARGAEHALGRAIARAGDGLFASPNLSGLHVKAGTDGDTLYLLESAGGRARVASRACRSGDPGCVVLIGDHRRRLPPGTLLMIGSGTGIVLRFVDTEPAAYADACGADCPERIHCVFSTDAPAAAPEVAGSVRYPASGPALPSSEPCPQPRLADGTRCAENPASVMVAAAWVDGCIDTGPAETFTEVHTRSAAANWGFPAPGAPAVPSAGAAAQPVSAARFWTRRSDSTLVRQRDPLPDGGWGRTDPVAGPVLELRVETLHAGELSWRAGVGISAADLAHAEGNPNFVRAEASDAALPAWRFQRGYNTVAAARVTYLELRPSGGDSVAPRRATLLRATPAVRAGARWEDSQ